MSIIWIQNGDIFESRCQALVCPVNTVGVMGKGLALEFKRRWPFGYSAYQRACEGDRFLPGSLVCWSNKEHWIVYLPTKRHWSKPSLLAYVESGLGSFVASYRSWGITSIAFPALGCGLGGLDWADVRPLMERYLGGLDIPVEVYEPRGAA